MTVEYDELVEYLKGCPRVDVDGVSFRDDKGNDIPCVPMTRAKRFSYVGEDEDVVGEHLAKKISEYIDGKSTVIVRLMPFVGCVYRDEEFLKYNGLASIIAY